MANLMLWEATFYDIGDNFPKGEDWQRYTNSYVLAPTIEKAQSIAKKNCTDNQIVSGIRSMNNQPVLSE